LPSVLEFRETPRLMVSQSALWLYVGGL
jgi:hypothetical protein